VTNQQQTKTAKTGDQGKPQDPRQREAKPPFPEQKQPSPGIEAEMQPQPDYGENSYRGSGKLTGKAALITGADSGIGRAVALAFAREGADVLIAYLNEDQDAQETKRVVEAAGRKAITVAGDIQDQRHCQQLVQRAMQEFGHLDILVNNAAFQVPVQDIKEITPEIWERHFRTNIFAMFYLCQAAIPQMRPGSSIINTASIEAYKPAPFLLPYATTKGAIVTFTMSLAEMVAEQGIRVNAVAPGPVWTPLIASGMPEQQVPKFGQDSPMKRPAQPIELAPVYVLLASDEASYISGEIYGVTGGKPLF
jgi:NAD(P)-dependent dehydrogenase (short-subunit alcohol dehydrogenase family)